jgi:enamine deaminase RidA (YjgF/YER057c/UK114 family)
MFTSPG